MVRNSSTYTRVYTFVKSGGLTYLFEIFLSGELQSHDGQVWNEWNQDCIASLLRLIYQFGIEGNEDDHLTSDGEAPRKRAKRIRKGSNDKLLIPKLNKVMLQVMGDTEHVVKAILNLMCEAASPCHPNQYKTGFWGRAQIVSCAMTLLVSWAFSEPQVRVHLFQYPDLTQLLKHLVLDDPEPSLRREACTGFYRLCLGTNADGPSGYQFVIPLLNSLLTFLSVAQDMKPPRPDEEDKEPYGPGCKDYFWLVCRLVDSLDEDMLQEFKNQREKNESRRK